MNEMNLNAEQQPTTLTPEENGGQGRLFSQDEVNRIVSDRLARERAKTGDDGDYKAKYESVLAELNGLKAEQLHQQKEAAYRDLMLQAGINEKRLPMLMRASRAEIDTLELDDNGKPRNAEKLIEGIKTDWEDFIVKVEIRGADTPNPPYCTPQPVDKLADAFKPKI